MSRKIIKGMAVAASLAALAAIPVSAHHSSAMYDGSSDARVYLQGVVFQFEYVQPHATLVTAHVQRDAEGNPVLNEDGSPVIVLWGWEMASPSLLRERGVGPNFWERGQPILVSGGPLRDGRPAGLHRSNVTVVDGVCRDDGNGGTAEELRELFPDFCPAEAPAEAEG
jgi:hypothetical protein